MKRIQDQVIVITGASSGIGLVTAKEAAGRGAKVVLAARNAHDLDRAIEEIRAEGGDAIAVPTDVSDYAQVERLGRRAMDEYGRIDTWVNNAAVSLYGAFEEVQLEEFRQVVEVVLFGYVNGAKVALPYLARTDGALICVGSTLSDRGVPLQTAYCAAKHAIKGWLDGLRLELQESGSGIRVTLVKPSSINTPLFEKAKTYLGVEPMPIPPIYDPRLAAAAILHAARSHERDLFVGGWGKVLSVAERLSPKIVDLQLRRTAFRQQRTKRPKSPDAPSNLFAPVDGDGGERGDFTGVEKRHSLYQPIAEFAAASSLLAATGLGLGALALARTTKSGAVPAVMLGTALLCAGKAVLALAYER